jgi:hypothetical protein
VRRIILSVALLASLAAAPLAAAETVSDPAKTEKPEKPAKDDPNRIVCTREHEVGSNRPKKVCMTVAQREELRERARRNMDQGRSAVDRGVATPNTGG